ncbi:hypothetical protein CR513_39378, partial [Mucuna pruriens]
MIPIKIEESSPQTTFFQPTSNEEELRVNLTLLQKKREVAHVREYVAKAKASKDNLVLRRVLRNVVSNKLNPNWEGQYIIVEEVDQGAFKLEHLDGRRVPHT